MNKVETHRMEGFLKLLDEREDVVERERGLITGMRLQSVVVCIFRNTNDYSLESHLRVRTFAMKPPFTVRSVALIRVEQNG